jgi:hypothetical protein
MMAKLRTGGGIEAWNVTSDFDLAVKVLARDMEAL